MHSSELRSQAIHHARTALVVFAMLLSLVARAQDLGVIGPVFPIAEPSLLEVILSKLREAEATGVLARIQRETQANVKRGIEQPAPVERITKTIKARSFYYDPSIVVPYAIADAEGKVIVTPGTRVNPLDTVSLSKALLFIDARDPAQVGRARKILDERGGKVKVILTGGSYLDLMRRWKRPVFYDQQGSLIEKLGIRHVPALVSQEGKKLKIEEILR
ncbi:MAG: type-F conjugative transfer system protein TraW [Bradyrhizobium sp.]|uniref:type-F conjugative transfer system protein TraW n=1 Tax=Bradyrhizobium sp. TaxID=376 RepID=UPI003D0BF77D